MWKGPAPTFHGLPYSYAHRRRGRRRHFAKAFISTSTNTVCGSLRMDLQQQAQIALLTDTCCPMNYHFSQKCFQI
jgi:hypothetical protein